jgi:RNA polymerase sigma factor (sigma-70 family)
MKTNFAVEPENMCDASLVDLCLTGDREAFGQIVSRYQSPICALAYSACGNVTRSEDLAQEIFITAWRKLRSLREPARFKAWLYGIARHLIHNAFRQHQRNPVAEVEFLEDAASAAPSGGEPDEQVISKEEETILWHVLSGLPEVYREPMVLFYRQNESVSAVADALSISEEAVRQRLSRGRALLNERVTKVVQNGLRQTGPATSFAMAVVAGLPALAAATTAKGALVGMATTQSGKAAGILGALKSIGFFAGIVAIPAIAGSYFGQKLGGDSASEGQRRRAAAQFWRLFIRGMIVFLFAPLLLTLGLAGFLHDDVRAKFLSVMTVWLGLAYPFVPMALIYWAWQRRRKNVEPADNDDDAQLDKALPAGFIKRNARRLVLLLTVAAAALLVFCYLDMGHNVTRLNAQEARDLIEKSAPQNLRVSISVSHYRSIWGESAETFRTFLVQVIKDGKKISYWAPVSDGAVSLLAQKGVACPVYIQGRDFEVLGTPGRFLPFLTAFVLAIGAIFILKQRRSAGVVMQQAGEV